MLHGDLTGPLLFLLRKERKIILHLTDQTVQGMISCPWFASPLQADATIAQ